MARPKRTYWYRRTLAACPVCGRGSVTRERVYGRKPKSSRVLRIVDAYDWCDQ
jgi:hypothetical protein